MTEPTVTRRAFIASAGAVAAGSTAAIAPATADSTPPQGILADGLDGGDFWAFLAGLRRGYTTNVGPPGLEAEGYADRAANEFRANTDAWIAYGNWLLTEFDDEPLGETVIEATFALTRGRWPTSSSEAVTTVTAEYDDEADEFTSLDWTLEEPDDPDYHIMLKDRAAENAADELSEYRNQFIDDENEPTADGDHELPDEEYVSEIAGRYASSIRFGEDRQHALSVLLGDFEGI